MSNGLIGMFCFALLWTGSVAAQGYLTGLIEAQTSGSIPGLKITSAKHRLNFRLGRGSEIEMGISLELEKSDALNRVYLNGQEVKFKEGKSHYEFLKLKDGVVTFPIYAYGKDPKPFKMDLRVIIKDYSNLKNNVDEFFKLGFKFNTPDPKSLLVIEKERVLFFQRVKPSNEYEIGFLVKGKEP